ncbi:MAG: class I tRNA ligase family protein, partial [Terriglobia bacterium]
RLRSYRAFANKIWNAARFALLNLERFAAAGGNMEDISPLTWRLAAPLPVAQDRDLADRWIFSRLERATGLMNLALERFAFHEAAHVMYHFFWHELCDWYIEWIKPRLVGKDLEASRISWLNLFAVFDEALRLLHPFMPFLTEELWHRLPRCESLGSIALQRFPKTRSDWVDHQAEEQMALLQEAITTVRNMRAEMKIDAKRRVPAELASTEPAVLELFRAHQEAIVRLATLSEFRLHAEPGSFAVTGTNATLRHAARFDARVPLSDLDRAHELNRLRQEKEKLEGELARLREQLENRQFRAKAPENVVRAVERRQAEYNTQYQKLVTLLGTLETSR